MSDKFRVTYGNDDGYVGNRPHHCRFDSDDLWAEMTEDEMRDFFWERLEEDFKNSHLNIHSSQEAEFIAWAKEQLTKMQDEERATE